MPDKLAARVAGHADDGEQAVGRAMEAALAAQRLYEAAAEKQQEAVRHLADASASFSAIRAVVHPPVGATAETRRPPDSVRLSSAAVLAFLAVGLSAWAGSPYPEVRPMDGVKEFKKGHYAAAAKVFKEAGDRHKEANSHLEGGQLDLAVEALDGLSDGRADYIRGLVAEARGDGGAALALFHLARDRGDDLAPLKLKQLGEG